MHYQANVMTAFSLTLMAGLATGIGSLIAAFAHHTKTRFLSFSLGFSAGVMIYVSFIEIFVKARIALTSALGDNRGYMVTTGAFFAGMLVIALIDKFVPEFENPHELREIEDMEQDRQRRQLLRMGVVSALAIAIHNFPEGIATFASALADPKLGIGIAVAIAIHNIPEGIVVAVPLYYATGNRRKACLLSFLSGLSEPVGALIGYTILYRFLNDAVFGFIFAMVAGIMVYISLDQLLPTAEKYGEHHVAIYGLFSGMAIMAGSLLLFAA